MKTFREFITEVYDKDVMGSSQIRRTGEGGRIGAERKNQTRNAPHETNRRGKTAPSEYKTERTLAHNVHALLENNNPQRREVLLHCLLKRHNAKHIKRESKRSRSKNTDCFTITDQEST